MLWYFLMHSINKAPIDRTNVGKVSFLELINNTQTNILLKKMKKKYQMKMISLWQDILSILCGDTGA